MTDETLNRLIAEAVQELADDERKHKICLIEDIFRCKRLLFGWGVSGHEEVISNPAALFDRYWDKSVSQLEVILQINSYAMSMRAKIQAGLI